MKRVLLLISFTVLLSTSLAIPASAHELQTDGNMGAVLHIEPDDDPVVGIPQSFDLYFEALTGHFSLGGCNCGLRLSQNGQTIYSHMLTATNNTVSQNPYTFAKDGVYELEVTGTPKQPGTFDTFKLTYAIRTEAASGGSSTKLSPATVAGLILLQALVLLALYTYFRP